MERVPLTSSNYSTVFILSYVEYVPESRWTCCGGRKYGSVMKSFLYMMLSTRDNKLGREDLGDIGRFWKVLMSD